MPLPTTKTTPKTRFGDFISLIYGPPGIGKCLSGNTLLMDPDKGGFITLKEVVENRKDVYTYLSDTKTIERITPSRWINSGCKPLYRLVTLTGREILASQDHRFLLETGEYKCLKDLNLKTDRLAIVETYSSDVTSNEDDKYFLDENMEITGYDTLVYRNINSSEKAVKLLNRCARNGYKAVRYKNFANIIYPADYALCRHTSIMYDRIVSIEWESTEQTYDLEIPVTHNFIAQDFIVHNSTLVSQFDDVLFMATEWGLNALSVYAQRVTSWQGFLNDLKEFAAGKHNYKTLAIDTVDILYKLCSEYKLGKLQVEHEGDLPFGKGYSMVDTEFQRVINRLTQLPYGLVFISHSTEKEVDTRMGKVKKIVPTLGKGANRFITGLVDIILYCENEPTKEKDEDGKIIYNRVMRTKPTSIYEAKDRTGILPDTLPLDYQALVAAFNNKEVNDE